MSGDRDRLTEWLHASGLVHSGAIREWCECQQAADGLLPVVNAITAAELRERADVFDAVQEAPAVGRVLRNRADALDPK